MGWRQDRHLDSMDGHFHHSDHSGIHALHQPVLGMGGDEECRQHRMGKHFGGCQICMGRHLRLLWRHLGCHYRQDGFFYPAGQFQHGQCMDQRRGGCTEFLERDVLDDFQLLVDHPVHGDFRHCRVGKVDGFCVDIRADGRKDCVGWRQDQREYRMDRDSDCCVLWNTRCPDRRDNRLECHQVGNDQHMECGEIRPDRCMECH